MSLFIAYLRCKGYLPLQENLQYATKIIVVESEGKNLVLSYLTFIYSRSGRDGPAGGANRCEGRWPSTCQLKHSLTTTIARQLLIIILSYTISYLGLALRGGQGTEPPANTIIW